MRTKKDFKHRILALVLALVLTVSMGSGTSLKAFANEGGGEDIAIAETLEGASEDVALTEDAEDLSEENSEAPGDDAGLGAPEEDELSGEELAPATDDTAEPSGDAEVPSGDEEEGAEDAEEVEDAESEVESESEEVEEVASDDLLKEGENKYKVVLENVNNLGENGEALDILELTSVNGIDKKAADGFFYIDAAGESATSMMFNFGFGTTAGYEGFTYTISTDGSTVTFIDAGTEDEIEATNFLPVPDMDEYRGWYSASFGSNGVPKASGIITIKVKATLNAKFRVYTNNERDNQGMLSITSFKYRVDGGVPVTLVNSANWDSQLVTNGESVVDEDNVDDYYTEVPLGSEITIRKEDIETWWDDNAQAQEYTGFSVPEMFNEEHSWELVTPEEFYDYDEEDFTFALGLSDLDEGHYANFRIEGRPITQFYFDEVPKVEFEFDEDHTNFHVINDYDDKGNLIGKWYVAPKTLNVANSFEFTAVADPNYGIEYCTYELQRYGGNWPDLKLETYGYGKCYFGTNYGEFKIDYEEVHSLVSNETNLVMISARTFKNNDVSIVVPENNIDVTIRVGSQLVNVEPVVEDGKKTYHVGAEDNTQVVVTIAPNSYSKVTEVKLKDAKHASLSKISLSKTGEYTIAVGKDDARLEVYADPQLSIVVKDRYSGDFLEPVNGQFVVRSGQTVDAYLAEDASGNKYAGLEHVYCSAGGITHTEDNNNVGMEWVKNKGITGQVWFQLGEKEYTAKISFETDITEVTVAGEKNGAITIPYGTDYSAKVTVKDAKADKSRISAYIIEGDGAIGGPIDFGSFDGTSLKVSGEDVLSNYNCGSGDVTVKYGFFVDGDRVGAVHTLILVNQIRGKKPTVKASVNDSTLHDIGLSLSVPKGINTSAKGLCYEVIAVASDDDEAIDYGFDPDDYIDEERQHSYYDKTDGDSEGNKKTNLNYWDYEKHCLVERYKATVTTYVPVTQKNASIRVAIEDGDSYNAWQVNYNVTVELVYRHIIDPDTDEIQGYSYPTDCVVCATRSHCYETKLALTKKAPAKIYSGENNVLVATPKFSAATTMRELDHVTLLDSSGRACDDFYGDDEHRLDNYRWISYNSYTNDIYLSTSHVEDDDNIDYLQGGKYTIVAYARAGSGIRASASVTVTVANPIAGLEVTPASATVLKNYNKAATMKTSVAYRGLYDDPRRAPDTKKIVYYIAKEVLSDLDNNMTGFVEFKPGDPLYGKISVNQKNGTITVDKSFLVTGSYSDNCFYVVVKANDYADNMVYGFTGPIEISAVARIPTTIRLMHVDDHYDDEGEYQYTSEDDSGISNGNKNVDTGNASYVTPYVYDQYFNRMDPGDYTLKTTGFATTDDGKLVVNKPGKQIVTATSNDGSKKSVKLQFTTAYCDNSYTLNVLFQDGRKEWGDYWESFHEWVNGEAVNEYPSPTPVYVSVCGENDWSRALINHTISVKGGKITRTGYGESDVSTTYTIVPSAYKTVITVTDKTSGRAKADKTKTFTIVNTAYTNSSNTKAVKLTADKKSIISGLEVDEEYLAEGGYANPNKVKYTATSLPAGTNKAVLTVDDPRDDVNRHEFMRALAGTNDDSAWQLCRGGILWDVDDDGKSITIPFYQAEDWDSDENNEYWHYRTGDIKPGSYTFYVTFGKFTLGSEGVPDTFVATAAPTKISIKVTAAPKPKATFTTTKITLTSKDNPTFKFKAPTVSNGLGISDWLGLEGTVTKGIENDFANLLYVDNVEGRAVKGEDGCYTIRLNEGCNCRITIGRNKEVHYVRLDEMWMLKGGELAVRKYGEEDVYFTPAEEKAAYKEWLKNNKSGYVNYEMVCLDGRNTNYTTQKLTLDIEKLIDSYEED